MNWQNAIKEYQLYLKIERGLSKNTIDSHTKDLEKLCLFFKENNMSISPIAIDAIIVKEFIYELAKKVAARSQARTISGLRSFFNYLVFEEYRNTNPTDLLETPKIGTKLPDTLFQNEINELFKSFRTINFRLSFS
jgi:integrase/recombinase XerD